MNTPCMLRRPRFIVMVALLSLFLIGCTAQRQGVSWADLTLIGEEQNILVAYNDYMVLIDPANGRPIPLLNSEGQVRTDEDGNPRRWEVEGGETDSRFYTTPILLDDNTYLAADYNNKFVQVNFLRAEVEASPQFELPGHVIADPVVNDGRIIAPFTESNVAAFDVDNGDQLWLFETERGVWAEPMLLDGILYVAGMDHNLYALEPETGNLIWQTDMGGAMGAAPLYEDDHFYVGTFNRAIFDVSIEGEILAEYRTENWVWSTPVLRDGVLYATDLSGFVYALDAENDLAEIWKSDAASDGIRPSPLVTDDYVIVADRGGGVYWLERETGNTIYEQDVDAEILSELIVVDPEDIPDPLLVVSTVAGDKVLVAFTLNEAAPRWTYDR